MNIYDAAKEYLRLNITRQEYAQSTDEDIRYLFFDTAIKVSPNDVITAINKFMSNEITLNQLVEWVNIIWFSDAYEFDEEHTDSIVSVIDQLECLDEENVTFSEEQYKEMISCLKANREFPCLFT